MTETSGSTHLLLFPDSDRKVGSIGSLLPTFKARLVEDDDGKVDAEEGQPGELWLQGPTIMKVRRREFPMSTLRPCWTTFRRGTLITFRRHGTLSQRTDGSRPAISQFATRRAIITSSIGARSSSSIRCV
jgi:acyl-CoA synthetase (AMP-forming)/AMP-acid ligase II